MEHFSKFFILGTPGSGKTTLAQKLSTELKIPHFNLDDYLYEKDKNPLEVLSYEKRIANATEIASNQGWVAEGNFLHWTGPLVEGADVVVWIRPPILLATWRIIKRDIVTRLKGTNKHKFWNTVKVAKGSYIQHGMHYDKLSPVDGEISPQIIAKTLEPFKDKVIEIRNKADLKQFLHQIKG